MININKTLVIACVIAVTAATSTAPQESVLGKVAADQTTKNAAEGSTFAAALLPLVNYCNPASAATVAGEMKFGQFILADYPDFAAVKTALESTYPCLGITCAQVGGLQGGLQGDPSVAACVHHKPIA